MHASLKGSSTPCNSMCFWATVIYIPLSMTNFVIGCPNLYMYSKHLAGVRDWLEIGGSGEKMVVTYARESRGTVRKDDRRDLLRLFTRDC